MGAMLRGPDRYNKNGIIRRGNHRTLSDDVAKLGLQTEIDPPAVEAPLGLAPLHPHANATVRPLPKEAAEEETPGAATTTVTRGGSTEEIQQCN